MVTVVSGIRGQLFRSIPLLDPYMTSHEWGCDIQSEYRLLGRFLTEEIVESQGYNG